MTRNTGVFVLMGCLIGACAKPVKRPCAEFEQAKARFSELNAQLLDPTFTDPRFALVAEAFEALPEHCEGREEGLGIARAIRDAARAGTVRERAAAPPETRPRSASPPRPLGTLSADERAAADATICAAFIAQQRTSCRRRCAAGGEEGCDARCERQLAMQLEKMGCSSPVTGR